MHCQTLATTWPLTSLHGKCGWWQIWAAVFYLGGSRVPFTTFFVGGRSTLKCGAETPSNASLFLSPGALECFDFITSLTTQFRQGSDLFIPRAIIYKLTANELERSVLNQPTHLENSELRTYFSPLVREWKISGSCDLPETEHSFGKWVVSQS